MNRDPAALALAGRRLSLRGRQRTVAFIVGMGRSGSSALARVLSICGGALPLELLPENFANPTGYWEPAAAVRLNDRFLHAHQSSWYDGTLRLQTGTVGAAERDEFVARIAALLCDGFGDGEPLVLKEPRIGALLPYWTAAAAKLGLPVRFIHIFREPFEVAASLAARDGLTQAHAFALWLKYNLIAERDGRGAPRIFVSYERVLAHPESVVARCADELGLGVAVGRDERRAIEAFLSPALRHHRGARTAPADAETPNRWLNRVYDLLREAESGRVRTDEFDALRRDYTTSRGSAAYGLVSPLTSGGRGSAAAAQ